MAKIIPVILENLDKQNSKMFNVNKIYFLCFQIDQNNIMNCYWTLELEGDNSFDCILLSKYQLDKEENQNYQYYRENVDEFTKISMRDWEYKLEKYKDKIINIDFMPYDERDNKDIILIGKNSNYINDIIVYFSLQLNAYIRIHQIISSICMNQTVNFDLPKYYNNQKLVCCKKFSLTYIGTYFFNTNYFKYHIDDYENNKIFDFITYKINPYVFNQESDKEIKIDELGKSLQHTFFTISDTLLLPLIENEAGTIGLYYGIIIDNVIYLFKKKGEYLNEY